MADSININEMAKLVSNEFKFDELVSTDSFKFM